MIQLRLIKQFIICIHHFPNDKNKEFLCYAIIFFMIKLQSLQKFLLQTMQRKPSYYVTTEETEDASSQQPLRTKSINNLQNVNIIDVWADNFHQEIQRISNLTKNYNIIAIDTEFPLIQQLSENFQTFSSSNSYQKYQKICKNVNSTSLIQLGLCISDQNGNVPQERFCWQFNFKYQQNIQQISPSSFKLLQKSGINFQRFLKNGINYKTFTHEFIKSGLLLNKKNKWIVFHGCYDFSYLLKLIKNQFLPKSIEDFYKSAKIYFPQKIDIKNYLQKDYNLKKFGLSKLADTILCRRIGPEHQAGSDSLLTMQCYFKLKRQFKYIFQNSVQIDNFIYGIGKAPQILIHQKEDSIKNQSKSQLQDKWNYTSNSYVQSSGYSQVYYPFNDYYQNNYSSNVPYYYIYSYQQSGNHYIPSSSSSYEMKYKPKYDPYYQSSYNDPKIKKGYYKSK